MPANRRLLFFITTIFLLITIAGCGGGSSLSFPTPTGGFTNSSLNGPFAFSYQGVDANGFLAVAGSFTADGAGNLTGGVEDLNSGAGIATNAGFTGTYTVRADGRGSANITSAAAGNSSLDFVIVAGGHALVTRFDTSATGSGTIDLQTASAFSNAALAGSFAFNLAGIDLAGNPLGLAGNFTANTSGIITTGVEDSNDNTSVVSANPLTGSIPVGSSGRGTATFNTSLGAQVFAFYVVDATHLKLVETDVNFVLGGDAFNQTGTFSAATLTGPFAFTVAGADILSGGPFAAGGVLTADGAGNVSSGTEDINDAGTISTAVAITGTYTLAADGRGTLQITSSAGIFNFVLYPTSGGILVLETDARFLTSGTALQQQTTAFTGATFSGTYGMNFTGATTNGEIDSIAEFTANGASSLTGIIDLNSTGALTFGQPVTGSYNVTSNGRAVGTLQTPLGTQNIVYYLVNGNRALFIEVDTTLVAAGDVRHQ
ncbi:MAG TPA: hypothetical protein VHA06_19155 [Candidatus Angelobacter sp.]|jgi:hypothetical protein|nr:hypothetical protein [Candidatus Angelobacter sp.]